MRGERREKRAGRIFFGYRVQNPVILTFAVFAVFFINDFPRFPNLYFLDLQVLAPNIPEDLTHWKAIFRELEGTVIELEEYGGDNNEGGDE